MRSLSEEELSTRTLTTPCYPRAASVESDANRYVQEKNGDDLFRNLVTGASLKKGTPINLVFVISYGQENL
jgi:hypothetical protein